MSFATVQKITSPNFEALSREKSAFVFCDHIKCSFFCLIFFAECSEPSLSFFFECEAKMFDNKTRWVIRFRLIWNIVFTDEQTCRIGATVEKDLWFIRISTAFQEKWKNGHQNARETHLFPCSFHGQKHLIVFFRLRR